MNCKKIRDLILTDYIDGEIDPRNKQAVDDHMNVCQECKKFLLSVRDLAKTPFTGQERLSPPEHVWHRIKETVSVKKKTALVRIDIWETLRSSIRVPRPIMAVACLVLIMFTIGALAGIKMYHPLDRQEIDFLDYSLEALSSDSPGDAIQFGTSIEEYFL